MPSQYADDIATIKERTSNILKQFERLNGSLGDMDKRVNDNTEDIARLQEQVGIWSKAQAGLTLVASAIAALVGVNINR